MMTLAPRSDTPVWAWTLSETMGKYVEQLKAFRDIKSPRGYGAVSRQLLGSLSNEEIAFLVLREIINQAHKNPSKQALCTALSGVIQMQVTYKQSGLQAKEYRNMEHIRKKEYLKRSKDFWTLEARKSLGMILVSIAEDVGIIETYKMVSSRVLKVRIKPELLDFIRSSESKIELLNPRYLPMIIPPKHWTAWDNGGYYFSPKVHLVRRAHRDVPEAPEVLETINKLQRVGFRVNKRLALLYKDCIQKDLQVAGLPYWDDSWLPEKPKRPFEGRLSKEEYKAFKKTEAWEEYIRQVKERVMLEQKNTAKRHEATFLMWVLDQMLEYPRFYFTYYVDFRSRIYYTQNFLNPQLGDIPKGLLQFAKGKPIDDPYWLKIALANAYGLDKKPFEDRIQWVNNNTETFMKLEEDPMANRGLWEGADSPWQFLSLAWDYAKYLKNPKTHRSFSIVYVDGTCNGLQHLSAMGLDAEGGASVNLIDDSEPHDIYAEIAHRVTERLQEELQGNQSEKAKVWLRAGVDRSLVKRNVMTLPYGVTNFGMRDQLFEHVKSDRNAPKERWLQSEYSDEVLTNYLGDVIMVVLEDALPSAVQTMKWLRACAREIKDAIVWETPMGFQVSQDYHKKKVKTLNTYLGKRLITTSFKFSEKTRDYRKQAAGIAPNFVHSMDASHLMKTVGTFLGEGDSVSLVHDSYGTHVADMGRLQKTLREEFMLLYKEDVLGNLKTHWENLYNVELPEVPEKGTLDIHSVRDSRYFFN